MKIHKLYSNLDEIVPSNHWDTSDIDEIFTNDKHKRNEIRSQLGEIDEQLNGMEDLKKSSSLSATFKLWPGGILIYGCLDVLEMIAGSVDRSYDEFNQYRSGSYSNKSLREFMESVIPKVEAEIVWIRKNVIEEDGVLPNHRNLLHAIPSLATTHHPQICNGPELVATVLIRLFISVMIVEMKVSIILGFANMYHYPEESGRRLMNLKAREAFEGRFVLYVNSFATSVDIANPIYLRACDPADGIWIRDKNFYELEGTFQTTIFRYHWGVCKYGSCNDIMFRHPNRCEPTMYSPRTTCSATVAECAYLSAIEACVLESGPYKFQYVNSSELGPLGRNFQCPENGGHLIKDGTGMNYVYAVCACNCYSSHNKINLLVMKSHIASNKVITGLRFIRKNRILYIQPREGKLAANGHILRFSERWIPLPSKVESSHICPINRANRVFFVDDLRLPPYHVLIGIKLNKVTRGQITGFAIEILGVPFDYETGKIYYGPNFLVVKHAPNDDPGRELSFEAVGSIYTTSRHSPNPADIKYVSLKQSKLRDDFGQSTLPFFDAVQITSNPSSVLGGIGIFHKGAEGYAGFISLRLFAIEYRTFFNDFRAVHMPGGKLSFNHSWSDDKL